MKLSQLRPCDQCGGQIAPMFYVVRVSMAVITQGANQTLGLAQYFGGNLALAETLSPEPSPVMLMGEEDQELWTELLICQNCYTEELNLVVLAERRNAAASEGE